MSKPLPSREYLLECFDYDKETDTLRWKKRPAEHFDSAKSFRQFNSLRVGNECGMNVKIDKTNYYKSKIIFKIIHGIEPSNRTGNRGYVEFRPNENSQWVASFRKDNHIMSKSFKTEKESRDWLDEKRKDFEKGHLVIKNKRNSTGFKGVGRAGDKYITHVYYNKKRYYLGAFNTAKEASNTHIKAKEEIEQGVFEPPIYENKTGFKGVKKEGNKYNAKISINGKIKYLGMFNTPEEAHEVYLKAKEERDNPPKPELTGIEWLQQLANEYKDFNKTLD